MLSFTPTSGEAISALEEIEDSEPNGNIRVRWKKNTTKIKPIGQTKTRWIGQNKKARFI